MKAKILIVDDEPEQMGALAQSLRQEGFEVVVAEDDREALYFLEEFQPDLIVLDVLFGTDERKGLDICKEIRELKHDRSTPIIILTGLADDELEWQSLELQADDFVSKSRPTKAILARVKRRLPRAMRELDVIDDRIEIDRAGSWIRVRRNDEWQGIHLEPREKAVLMKLVNNRGHTVTREMLESFFPGANNPAGTVRRYICELRSKLEPDPRNPRYILTERGAGYSFADDW
jgi:two-component system KDP operon response regulator KdpE